MNEKKKFKKISKTNLSKLKGGRTTVTEKSTGDCCSTFYDCSTIKTSS